MNDLRIGFIGCGRHASANIYPSLKHLGVQLTSVCAKHMESAHATAQQYGVSHAYDDYQQMLKKENLDAVFVVLPEQLHAGVVEDCLRAGTNVFVEKPLGLSAAEAAHVANVSARTGKHVMVGFMKRFAPAYVQAKRIMEDSSKFGEVLSLTGMFGVRPFGTEEFFIKNAAIHIVDLIRFLFGEIEDIVGFSNTGDGNIDILFSFSCKNGRIGNMFFAGVPSWARHYEEITITGSKGFVKAENMRKVICHYAVGGGKPPVPRWQLIDEEDKVLTFVDTSSSGGWKDLYLNGYAWEVRHFLESVYHKRAPSPSAEDNVKTMEFCDSLLKALSR